MGKGMRELSNLICLVGLIVLLPAVAGAQPDTNCLPSCEVNDGRFLAITDGQGLDTLTDTQLDISIRTDPDGTPPASFTLRIFDGETGGLWDLNSQDFDAELRFFLYADADLDGEPDEPLTPLGASIFPIFLEDTPAAENSWVDFVVPNELEACVRDAGDPVPAVCETQYSYILRAELGGELGPVVRSSFKAQTNVGVSIQVTQQPFAFVAAGIVKQEEVAIVYPDNTCAFPPAIPSGPFEDLAECGYELDGDGNPVPGQPCCLCPGGTANPLPFPTCLETYDGTFSFFLNVQGGPATSQIAQIEIWDGDLDRGKFDGTESDENDANTPDDELPPWGYICTEPGLQLGDPNCTVPCPPTAPGDPAPGPGDNCIRRLTEFEGVAVGAGPSSGNPPDDSTPDPFGITDLGWLKIRRPSIIYEVILRERFDGETAGLDQVLGTNANPSGNTEWEVFCLSSGADLPPGFPPKNADECLIQQYDPLDPGTTKLTAVEADVKPNDPSLVGVGLPPGIYEIRVSGLDLENLNAFRFDAEVVPEPELEVGDFVWLDENEDALQDPGEPGIPGVELKLWSDELQTTELATTTTNADGLYLFEGLVPEDNCGDASGCSYMVEVTGANFEPGGPLENLATTLLPPDPILLPFAGEGLVRFAPDNDVDRVGEGDVLTFDFPYFACDDCDGGVTDLTLRYNGVVSPATITVDDGDILFDDVVAPGGLLSFQGTGGDNKMGSNVKVFVNGILNAEIHTSCSQPIYVGLVKGDFEVVRGASRNGGPFCAPQCRPEQVEVLEVQADELKWKVKNSGNTPITVSRVVLEWPVQKGNLEKMELDGTFWQGLDAPPAADISSGFDPDVDKRTLDPDQTKDLKFRFADQFDAGEYFVRVEFGDASCALETSGAVCITDCEKPIHDLSMIWDGLDPVNVTAWKGSVGSTSLGTQTVAPGGRVTFGDFAGSPNDVVWEIFDLATGAKLGESEFHLSCSDDEMNGAEDCGNRLGNGKGNDPGLINDWIFDGWRDDDETLTCSPEPVCDPGPPPPGDICLTDCEKPIHDLSMIWDGTETVDVTAWKGAVGSTSLGTQTVAPGGQITFGDFAGSPNDVVWEIFSNDTGAKLGESEFHLSCSDDEMNGAEDCGNRLGNGKGDDPDLINDWIFDGWRDDDELLTCSPEPVCGPPPPPPPPPPGGICETASTRLDAAGKCAVFELGDEKVSASHGDPTGVDGNLCMAAGSELSMSGGQIITGTAFLDPLVNSVPDDLAARAGAVVVEDQTAAVAAVGASALALDAVVCDVVFDKVEVQSSQTWAATDFGGGEAVICVNGEMKVKGSGTVLTLTGDPGESFLFSIGGAFKAESGKIKVAGSLSESDVLYYLPDSGKDVAFSGGGGGLGCCTAEVDGTILAPQRKVSLSPGRVNGQVLSGKDISLASGSLVSCPPGEDGNGNGDGNGDGNGT